MQGRVGQSVARARPPAILTSTDADKYNGVDIKVMKVSEVKVRILGFCYL